MVEEKQQIGTQIVVRQSCTTCEYERKWSTQPSYGQIPDGNVQLSGAIFFNGASCSKVLRTLQSINIASISKSTFYDHASKYLQPTVLHEWKQKQGEMFEQLSQKDDGLILGADGRADSPGHSAKYGSYSVLEERINKVVDIQLVQVYKIHCIYNSINLSPIYFWSGIPGLLLAKPLWHVANCQGVETSKLIA